MTLCTRPGTISASRGAAAPSRHRRASSPGEEVVGGFFFDFGAVRTASRCSAQAKVSGYLHFSNEHRPEVTTRVNAMEGLAPRERSQKIIAELGKMWKALSEQDRADWKERAPVVKRKIKAKKPSKKRAKKTDDDAPAQRSSPVPYIGPETLVGPYPIDEEALRKLKRLHDDGIIDDDEFRQGKAKALGITPNNGPPTPNDQVGTVYRSSNPPPPPSPKVEKEKKEKAPKLELPQSCLEAFMGESCTCLQENPKRANTKSYDSYETYKSGTTLQGILDLGAKKADLAHDLARNYITIDDPQKQQALLANLRPVKKRDTTEKTADEVEADKAFVAVTGRYYTRRVKDNADPEEKLEPGFKGPANYRNATGALVLDAPSGKAAGGCLIMKGINSTKDDRPLVPKLVPKSKSGKTSTDGFINFKLKARGVSGTLRLKVASSKDHQNNSILVGNLRIKEGETEWVENIRAFRAAADTDDWPDELPQSSA